MKDVITEARAFAIARHADQSYGSHPYSHHLDEVAKMAEAFGKEAVAVAYLHDVVEDTDTTKEEVVSAFGPFIGQCVFLLTDEQGSNRKERKAKTFEKLSGVSVEFELALIVKTADRLANVRACIKDDRRDLLRMYKKEHLLFKRALYRPNLCEDLWHELDEVLNTC